MTDGAEATLSCPADNRDVAYLAAMEGDFAKVAVKVCGIQGITDSNDLSNQYATTLRFGPAQRDGVINETGITAYNVWLVDGAMARIGNAPIATQPVSSEANISSDSCCDDGLYSVSVSVDLSIQEGATNFMIVPDTFPIGVVSSAISDDSSGSATPEPALPVVRQSAQVTFPDGMDACESSVQENLKSALAEAYTQASSAGVSYTSSDVIYLGVSGCSERRLAANKFGANARLRSLTDAQTRDIESLLSVQNLAEAQSMNQDLATSSNLDSFKTRFSESMGSTVTMDSASVQVDVVQELQPGEFTALPPPEGETWDTVSPDFDLDEYANQPPGGVNTAAAFELSYVIRLFILVIAGLQLRA